FQLPQRLYGRASHAAALLQGFERVARSGRPELVLVRGYSGIGKSSVVHELHKPVVRRRGFFLSGKFDQFQQDIPYATLAQALRGLVQQLLAGSEEEFAQWRAQVNQAWEGQGQLLVELVPRLEVLVGRQPVLQQLSSSEVQLRFFRVVRQFLSVFATKEHPMVVFLDDLQWADLPSLRLLEQLLSQPESPPVLWLGAYRDNEVNPAHPLRAVLEEVRKAGARLTDVRLEPLSVAQVEQLVGDTLPGAGRAVVVPLAALVHEKTGGNPFFLLQLLVTLHQEGLLERVPGGGWRWDAEGVRARDYSENIVDFMVGKLRQLPPGTQHLLRLAACAGNVFSLELLGTLSGVSEVEAVEQGLEPALREGMLVHVGAETYRFLHDRIQQAAHLLSSEAQRQEVHLRIGRLLLQRLSPEQVRESLFEVVSQLNAGVALMEDPTERHQLARLNAEAGNKAQAALALRPALTYFTTAFALIPADPWETDHALAFLVRLAQARTELMSGAPSEAQRLAEELRSRARTRADTVALHLLTQDIHFATGAYLEGMNSIRECLELLGMPLSRHSTWEEAVAAHAEVWALLGPRPIESLLELPLMTDPDMKLAVVALFKLFPGAYSSDPHLLIILLSRIVCLTLRHGVVDAAVPGYTWFGVIIGSFFKRYREGFAFARLALGFVERHHLSTHRGNVLLGMQFSSYWVQPIARAQELLLNGLRHALQVGAIAPATYCSVYLVTNRLAMGHSLDEVHQESLVRAEFLRKTGFVDPQEWLLVTQCYVQQ
ncbi:MAG TPA: AAA family ATPase, partial [Cystobacter sp.]